MQDNPDWTLPVSVRAQEIENLSVDIASQSISELTIRIVGQDVPVTIEPATGVTFNIQGQVDANITNTEINAYVTNSTITITPEADAVFEIKPATGVTFNIQGDVNITNTELNVKVTNSTLNVTGDVNATIQGTASVSIDNATVEVDTATVFERVTDAGKLKHLNFLFGVTAGSDQTRSWTNTFGYAVYLEMISGAFTSSSSSNPPPDFGYCCLRISIYDDTNNHVADYYFDPVALVVNFDPAIKLPPSWKIEITLTNNSDYSITYITSLLLTYR